MSRHFTPPPGAQVEKAWAEGRADGNGNKPRGRCPYADKTLQVMYERGYARGRQEALQARFGDAATANPGDALDNV